MRKGHVLILLLFYHTVRPRIFNFTARPQVARSGSSFVLQCLAEGFPQPGAEHFGLTKSSPAPPIHFPATDYEPTESGVVMTVTDISKRSHSGAYSCLVNVEYLGNTLQARTSIDVEVYSKWIAFA